MDRDVVGWRGLRAAVLLSFLLVAWVAAARAGGPLYVGDSRLGASLLELSTETGERRLVDLDDYPVVMAVRAGVEAPTGEVFLEAINAAGASTLVRFDPATGEVVGISGFVERDGGVPRGSGPDFEPGLVGMVPGPRGTVYVLRRGGGPMAVDVRSGDRLVVSQSAAPEVGSGAPLVDPIDLVVERSGSILVADRFGGLVRVAPRDGTRQVAFVFQDLVEGPHRIERLPDGRVVHAFGAGDGRAVTVLDRSLRTVIELSGPARGSGPDFVGIVDLVVAADGTLYVLDLGQAAVLAVDPVSGDRRIVSQDVDRVDLALLSPQARFTGHAVPGVMAAPRASSGRLGRR